MDGHIMATEERQSMERLQDALAVMKTELRCIQRINTDAGRLEAANATMGALGSLMVWHAKATKELRRHWPDFADDIQTRGGGGR